MSVVISQETQQQTVSVPQVRDKLIIWYHETDHNVLLTLDPHLQVLVLRLANRFHLNYYSSPKTIPQPPVEKESEFTRESKEKAVKEYQEKYQAIVRAFSRAALFLPCVSPAFMQAFWKDSERDAQLQTHLTQPAFPILPVLIRPMAGVANTVLPSPLTAYAEGNEREAACATLAATIEAMLHLRYPQSEETPTKAPFLMLEAPRSTTQEVPRSKKRSFFSFNFSQK